MALLLLLTRMFAEKHPFFATFMAASAVRGRRSLPAQANAHFEFALLNGAAAANVQKVGLRQLPPRCASGDARRIRNPIPPPLSPRRSLRNGGS
jgi:hypothetical protein